MDIHACSDLSKNPPHIPSIELPNNSSITNSNVTEEQEEEALDSVEPITPHSNKESVAQVISNFTSPFPTFSSPPKHSHSHSHSDQIECSTPKEGVFDPFAPGPDNLMLAPYCPKHLTQSLTYIPRRLNFHSDSKCVSDDETTVVSDDEDKLLEAVYQTLLKAIISKQAEEELLPPAISTSNPPSPDGFKTPTSAPLLNGITETCPGAPHKPNRKLRNIDLGLCRKLEF